MDTLKSLVRDPEVWIYLIALLIGLAVFFTPVLRLCGGMFLLAGLILLGIKLYKALKSAA